MEGIRQDRLPRSVWDQGIRVTRDTGEILKATGESLFAGGFTITVDKPLYSGEEVRLDTVLPNHGQHRLEPLSMRCRVTYQVELTHPARRLRIGLTPVSISQHNKQLLMQFAREQIRRRRAEEEAEAGLSPVSRSAR